MVLLQREVNKVPVGCGCVVQRVVVAELCVRTCDVVCVAVDEVCEAVNRRSQTSLRYLESFQRSAAVCVCVCAGVRS